MDYLTAEQLAYLRNELEQQKDRLTWLARTTIEQQLNQEENKMPDSLDVSLNESMNSTEYRLRDREQHVLAKIKKTIERMDEGNFGYCEECDDEIGFPRLKARPVAELCIECKEEKEKKDAQQRDRRDQEENSNFSV